MNILVVGGGAREHALCDAVCRSKNVNLYAIMSNLNPGIERLAEEYLLAKETDIEQVIAYAKMKYIELALIGPEAPLEIGITNALQNQDITVCAPTKEAAQIETDKEWMRNLLDKHRIRGRLQYKSFTDAKDARIFIEELHGKVVIKPIGLTGGKGVRVADDHFHGIDEAMAYVNEVIDKKISGKAKVLIEEKAEGEEFTVQAFADGSTIIPLPAVQDHKRLLPDDCGPNTGGMGSYSCANGLLPFLSKKDYDDAVTILKSIVAALKTEGCSYIGPTYGQFMFTIDGPKIIEINARFGDPENMNVLPLLSTDFIDVCHAMVDGTLSKKKVQVNKLSTVCKYVVPEGYGTKSMVGEKIFVDETAIHNEGAKLFYASVNKKDGFVYTTSSRSLAIVGSAHEVDDAEQMCERALTHVRGDHIFIRHDIGTNKLLDKRVNHMKEIRKRK